MVITHALEHECQVWSATFGRTKAGLVLLELEEPRVDAVEGWSPAPSVLAAPCVRELTVLLVPRDELLRSELDLSSRILQSLYLAIQSSLEYSSSE